MILHVLRIRETRDRYGFAPTGYLENKNHAREKPGNIDILLLLGLRCRAKSSTIQVL